MRLFIKFAIALVVILIPTFGLSQNGFWTDRAVGTAQFNGFTGLVPISYGQVRVCTFPASGSPCTPLATVFDINGNLLPIVGGNFGQVTTDVVGRFSFQAAPGSYLIQVAAGSSNTPALSYPITIAPVGLFPSGVILAGNNTFTGSNTFQNTTTFNNVIVNGTFTLAGTFTGGTGTFTTIFAQNIEQTLNVDQFATGGNGTSGSPWTSASGSGGLRECIVATGTTLGHCHMPAGFYNITVCVNATANSATGFGVSSSVNPLIIDGDGQGKTFLIGNTGSCVLDITGRGNVTIRDLAITQGSVSKSVIGIQEGRSTAAQSQFSQFNRIENLFIELPTVPAANGGNGTVGIYNNAAEGNLYINNLVAGDHPLALVGNNIYGVTSAYVPNFTGFTFMSQTKIIGGAYVAEGVSSGEAILVQGQADDTSFENVTTECGGSTPTIVGFRFTHAVAPDLVSDPMRSINIQNLQAECPGGQAVVVDAIMDGLWFNGAITNSASNTTPIILITGNGFLVNPFLDVTLGSAGLTDPLIGDNGAATQGIQGGLIKLHAQAGINFTNAASGCADITILASFASPSIRCANVINNFTGWVQATDLTNNFSAGVSTLLGNTGQTVGTITSGPFTIQTAGVSRWLINVVGNILPLSDNTYDIGTSSNRPRDIFASRAVRSGTNTNNDNAGHLTTAANTATYTFLNVGYATAPACVASTSNATTAVKVVSTPTSVTFTTVAATENIAYVCWPQN